MRHTSHQLLATLSASVLAIGLVSACAPQVPAGATSAGSGVEASSGGVASTSDGGSATSSDGGATSSDGGGSATSTDDGSTGTTAPGFVTGTNANTATPLLAFGDDEGAQKLVADMAEGRVPVSANVLYDQMGSRPDAKVTDPETIAQIYDLVSAISVVGESGYSVTDSYHHVYFTLQDGTTVGYNFEGEGNLVGPGGTNYLLVGDSPLWSFVRQLQEGSVDDQPRYAISFSGDEDLISALPSSARAGETITFVTGIATDVFIDVTLDGEPLEPVPANLSLYAFVMPDHDVHVELVVSDIYGGGA